MTVSIWINNPAILLHKDYIFELWPLNNISHNQKINAITRMIILLTVIGFVLTKSYYIVAVGLTALLTIVFLSKSREPILSKEPFSSQMKYPDNDFGNDTDNEKYISNNSQFENGSSTNPFGNVLLTDIHDNPERKSAPQSFTKKTDNDIKKNIKKMITTQNQHMKDKKTNLWDEFQSDRSNHSFYSTANTRVENDQTAFSNFLYGNMHSSKESDANGSLMRTKNASRYTLF